MGRVCSDKKKEKKKKKRMERYFTRLFGVPHFFMCRGKGKQQGNETKVVPVKIMTLFRIILLCSLPRKCVSGCRAL